MVGPSAAFLVIVVHVLACVSPASSASMLTSDLMKCFKYDSELSSNASESGSKGAHVMVLGITHNCYLYYGSVSSPSATNLTREIKDDGNDQCKDKRAFKVTARTGENLTHSIVRWLMEGLMLISHGSFSFTKACRVMRAIAGGARLHGDTQPLVIVVDRFGRRVRVQPAIRKKPKFIPTETGGTVWHYVNPRNRLEQFYSDNVDRGFTITGFFYFKNRVIVYAVSHSAVRFYHLRLHIGNNYITPYLQLVAEPDLKYVYPHKKMKITSKSKTDMTSTEIVLDQGDGHVCSSKIKNVIAVEQVTDAADEIVSRCRPREVDLFGKALCYRFGEPTFFKFDELMRPDAWMLSVSLRRWVNPMHAHRRMSYPHAIRRMKQHQFFSKGWARALPIVVANVLILLVGTLVFLRLIGYYNREYRKRRYGADSSFSVLSH